MKEEIELIESFCNYCNELNSWADSVIKKRDPSHNNSEGFKKILDYHKEQYLKLRFGKNKD